MPILVTEQYPAKLGATVTELKEVLPPRCAPGGGGGEAGAQPSNGAILGWGAATCSCLGTGRAPCSCALPAAPSTPVIAKTLFSMVTPEVEVRPAVMGLKGGCIRTAAADPVSRAVVARRARRALQRAAAGKLLLSLLQLPVITVLHLPPPPTPRRRSWRSTRRCARCCCAASRHVSRAV